MMEVKQSMKGSNSRNVSPSPDEVPYEQRGKLYKETRAVKAFKLPTQIMSDSYWKNHLRGKSINTVDQINQYADEVASEMTCFAADRLELLMAHLQA